MEISLKSIFVVHSHSKRKHDSVCLLSKKYLFSALTKTSAIFFVFILVQSAEGFNDEKGILKWNPYWFSNFRYSAPSSFYISPNRVGTPYKRLSDSMFSGSVGAPSSPSGGTSGIYKWSPVYFSGGSSPSPSLHSPSSYYGSGGAGYMYSSNRPRWSMSDYGGSRFLTRYYGGNSFIPGPRQNPNPSVIDLGSSNDLSALLGDELMNNGLGLENDTVDVLDGEQGQDQQSIQLKRSTK